MDETPGTAAWWRDRLLQALNVRALQVTTLENYYLGEHPLPSPPGKLDPRAHVAARNAWRELTRLGVTNWVKLVADAPAERMAVTGFRFGETKDDGAAWRIWQANHLDADQALVHDNALQTGSSAVIVWPGGGDAEPTITCEHSAQVIVAYEPGSRRRRAAALKSWVDDDGHQVVNLYLPDALWQWRTGSTRPGYGRATAGGNAWVPRDVDGEDWPLPNPLQEVPVVEFRANPSLRPSLFGGGTAEFESVLPIQDRLNKTIFDRLVTAENQAFRQRWAIGWDPPRGEDGLPDPNAMLKASQSMLMTFPGDPTEVKVGEFAQADFSGFLKAVEGDVTAMAAISQTPPYYLLGAMENISADGIVATDAGLVAKTRRHCDQFGESWEEVLRLALKAKGDPRADDPSTAVVWRNIEQRTWAQTVDALVKMKELEVPREELWSRLPNATPQDVARWQASQAADFLLTADPAAPVAE